LPVDTFLRNNAHILENGAIREFGETSTERAADFTITQQLARDDK
jgi:hypothetical protein